MVTESAGVRVTAAVPARSVQLDLDVHAGETLAVIGPNGVGKSTLLAVLSGLLRPDRGRVLIGADVVTDTETGAWTPPHRRQIGLLSQDPLLFPHLTALDNVAFGPRARGMRRAPARRQAETLLDRFGLASLAERRPSALSGGQAQRIALVRALASSPRLLLLDEPLSALDVDAKPEVRQLLLQLLPGLTTVLVTHDLLDAALLADRVAVLDEGRVVEIGPTTEVLAMPRSAFAARLAGLNIVDGVWDGASLRTADGRRLAVAPNCRLPHGARCRAVFRPSAVAVYTTSPGGSPRNDLEVTVTAIEPHGDLVRVRAGGLSADITPVSLVSLALRPGTQVRFAVKATEVSAYPL